MFTAIGEYGEKVDGTKAIKGEKYLCPICHEEVVYRNCTTKASHFAHMHKSECNDWGDMSEWHLGWQQKFPLECREFVMKNGEIEHRADVFIKEKKIVIEFQHSQISNEDFNERNKFYTGCGHNVIWIFDGAKKFKNPNTYECDFNKINNIFNFEKQYLVWKRCKKDNELLRTNIKITVFYEVYMEKLQRKALLPLKNYDNYGASFYWLYDYIYEESFLKSYSLQYQNSTEKSLEQIYFETQKFFEINGMEEKLSQAKIPVLKQSYLKPIGRRWWF